MAPHRSSADRQALLRRLRAQQGLGVAAGVAPRPDPHAPAALSPGQRRLWFFDRLRPGSAAYTIGCGLWLDGPLDVAALTASLSAVVARHEVLRTTYSDVDGSPVQLVRPATAISLPVQDVAGDDDARAEAAASVRRPFDLENGPVLRAELLRVTAERHLLVLAVHHIAADGWSLQLLVGELAEGYLARVEGREPAATPPPVQYADFARWQNEWRTGAAASAQLDFWAGALAGAPLADLPADRPRVPETGFAGDVVVTSLPAEVAAAVAALAERERTTPFVVQLAAFATVLARWSRQADVVVGVPAAGRSRAEVASLVGFFVNTLPVRLDLGDDPEFGELVRRTSAAVLDAQTNGEVPFDDIVERLRPERDTGGRTPLVRHLFQADETPLPALRIGPLGLTPEPVDTGVAKFDLGADVLRRADGGLDLRVEYSTELYDRATAERFAGSLRLVLAHADPAARVSALPLLDSATQAHITGTQSGAKVPPLPAPFRAVHEYFEDQVDRTPDAVAVVSEAGTMTYAELEARANRLARQLRASGVGRGSVVGIALPRGPELMVSLLAVLKAGGAYLPLDTGYPPARIEFMVADSRAEVVITDTARIDPELRGALATAPRLLCVRRDAADVAGRRDSRLRIPARRNDLAYVIYTSGSTGRPKGVMNEHRGVVNRLLWMQDAYRLAVGEGVLQKTPTSFDVSVWELFWPLMTGARCVLAKPGGQGDPEYLARLIAAEAVTTVHFVPSMLDAFLAADDLTGCAGALSRIVCSGEELPGRLVDLAARRLPGVPVFNLYGPTEAAVDVTWHECVPGSGPAVPIGTPIGGARTYVLDPTGAPVPHGVAGELLLGGVQVARGYHDRPALTAERFVPDPFGEPGGRLYRTGDLARLRADGAIEYLGRIDNQVKLRGMRLEPGEIEAALTAHPAVDSAVVDLRTGRGGTPALVGYVRPVDGGELAGAEPGELGARLKAHLRDRLPAHFVPSAFVPVPRWPLSPNGKLDRRRLPDPAPETAAEHVPPSSELERRVAEVWQEVLGLERVGVTDNFFDLGGQSLLATQVISRVTAQFGVKLPLGRLFDSPTVAGVAEAIAENARPAAAGPALRQVDRSAYRVPTRRPGVAR
ncbi:amino acid adenylation domain-containing protein [Amycolatopsis sp. NPDC049253]|uniref:amino acid adenylation domain-containing protein n=1 Tax=Amycolatopsis sp. NPDC049253 TaxID=3155274 RepID=UPI00342A57F8